jgi:endonuclease YncB( thermonuclease family)
MSEEICNMLLDLSYQNLCTIEESSLDYFNFYGQKFVVKPCHFYDGDTFSAIFNFNGKIIKYKCRCNGYDCAEIKPLKSNPNRDKEKELAKFAKDRFTQLTLAHPSGLCLIECGNFDKYGRILVTVYNGINTESINDIMIKEGHGKPYDGGTKDSW